MNEHSFIRSIHNKLHPDVYKWKIHDTFTGGVPDVMYCGPKQILFVEYKYLKRLPKKDTTLIRHSLTPQQNDWLCRINKPSQAGLIIGCENQCIILTCDFTRNISKLNFIEQNRTRSYVAEWISNTVLNQKG
tara:strand:- start:595 stop:990 length:396 start_codon:yes stop_codon:yes gene_type:complete